MLPIDIDVWLSTERQAGLIQVIPYVRTAEQMHIAYQVDLVRQTIGGSSKMSQKGKIFTSAQAPGALGEMKVDNRNQGVCWIQIELSSTQGDLGTYVFDCPT